MNREETFDFVLNEISKSALQALGMDAEEEIKKMLAETREKCGRQVIGVITAYSDIEDFGCSAEDTLAHLHVQDFI